MRIFKFHPRNESLISGYEATRLITELRSRRKKISFTADLGINTIQVEVDSEKPVIKTVPPLDTELLNRLSAHPEKIYLMKEDFPALEFFENEHYYKLRAISENDAPTLEIDGIHMHRIKNMTPWQDAKKKVSLLSISRDDNVLDICTGLGYTAILERNAGGKVVSIEVDECVLRMAEYNPYSRELEDITIIQGNAVDVVEELIARGEIFERIMLDPPRFSVAGELYSEKFYTLLYQILRKNGIMAHYIGSPGRVKGINFKRGIIRRLSSAGFRFWKFDDEVETIAVIK